MRGLCGGVPNSGGPARHQCICPGLSCGPACGTIRASRGMLRITSGTLPGAAAKSNFCAEGVDGCDLITQHSDTIAPQLVYKDYGGAGIGYNSNMRELVGDSVLTAPMLDWAPMFQAFISQMLHGEWQEKLQWWPGVAEGAVKLMPTFSPRVAPETVQHVEQEHATLRAATGSTAFRHIFCGPLFKRWVYRFADETSGPRAKGCGFQPSWRKLDSAEQINLRHYADKSGSPLPANRTVPLATNCLSEQALLASAFPAGAFDEDDVYNDYLVDGVELVDPGVTEFGVVHNSTTHGCTGTAVGD
eukprot:7389507-Prymnesium_polylepis.1